MISNRTDLQPSLSAAILDLAQTQGVDVRAEDANLSGLAFEKLSNEDAEGYTGGQFLVKPDGSHEPISAAVSALGLDGTGAFCAQFSNIFDPQDSAASDWVAIWENDQLSFALVEGKIAKFGSLAFDGFTRFGCAVAQAGNYSDGSPVLRFCVIVAK